MIKKFLLIILIITITSVSLAADIIDSSTGTWIDARVSRIFARSDTSTHNSHDIFIQTPVKISGDIELTEKTRKQGRFALDSNSSEKAILIALLIFAKSENMIVRFRLAVDENGDPKIISGCNVINYIVVPYK